MPTQITIQLTNDPTSGLPRYALFSQLILSDITDWYTIQYEEQIRNLNGDVVKSEWKSLSGGNTEQFEEFFSQTMITTITNYMTNNIS